MGIFFLGNNMLSLFSPEINVLGLMKWLRDINLGLMQHKEEILLGLRPENSRRSKRVGLMDIGFSLINKSVAMNFTRKKNCLVPQETYHIKKKDWKVEIERGEVLKGNCDISLLVSLNPWKEITRPKFYKQTTQFCSSIYLFLALYISCSFFSKFQLLFLFLGNFCDLEETIWCK